MTLNPGDRVRYVGDSEDFECAVGTVTHKTDFAASVNLDHNGGGWWFDNGNLEKVSGVTISTAPRNIDQGAAQHLARQADKAAAVNQYRDEHRGTTDPKYAPQVAAHTDALPFRVYLAGPMRGYAKLNFPLFYQAASIIRALGFHVVSPAEMDVEHGVDPDEPDETVADSPEFIRDAIFRDLHVVLYEVDGIVTLPGSEESKGVAVELAGAEYAGLPVFTFEEFVTAALAER